MWWLDWEWRMRKLWIYGNRVLSLGQNTEREMKGTGVSTPPPVFMVKSHVLRHSVFTDTRHTNAYEHIQIYTYKHRHTHTHIKAALLVTLCFVYIIRLLSVPLTPRQTNPRSRVPSLSLFPQFADSAYPPAHHHHPEFPFECTPASPPPFPPDPRNSPFDVGNQLFRLWRNSGYHTTCRRLPDRSVSFFIYVFTCSFGLRRQSTSIPFSHTSVREWVRKSDGNILIVVFLSFFNFNPLESATSETFNYIQSV